MEVVYRDLSRATSATLTVAPDEAAKHGGVDFVLIRPAVAAGATAPVAVAVTKLRFAPVG